MSEDRLDKYSRKRDFDKTPEPPPEVGAGEGNLFVIHKHQARRLHWDLRLERDGVLKSWAVPKEPSMERGVRRLAVAVEDHPLDYAGFAGQIPEGEYGAGTVEIWDRGTYQTEYWGEDKIVIVLAGERLAGRFALVHTGGKNWILMKAKEPDER
jgi:bifunctional non-homologous end joining protein LigD